MRRIVFALIATFSAFLLAATVVPAATAQQDTTITADRATADTASERGALPFHDVRWARRGETSREGIFFSRGKVVTWKGRLVKLQTKRGDNAWHAIKKDRTTAAQGVWSFRFNGRIGNSYRVLIPECNWARATPVFIGKIVRER
jgi:hypothetical protein